MIGNISSRSQIIDYHLPLAARLIVPHGKIGTGRIGITLR